MMDESAVTEKPKPTWKEYAQSVYDQIRDALWELENETNICRD